MSDMTSKERMKIALTGGTPDRIPVAPDFSVMIPCRLTGKPWWDILRYAKPPVWKAYIEAVDYFGIDGWFTYGSPGFGCSKPQNISSFQEEKWVDNVLHVKERLDTPEGSMTASYVFFENDAQTNPEKFVKNFKEDFKKLLYLFPEYDTCDYSYVQEQFKEFGDRGIFCTTIPTPGFHMLTNYFNDNLEGCTYAYYDYPELFEELVEKYEKHLLSQVRLAIEGGAECILTGGSGSITLQSPELWRKLSLPALKKITKMCKEAGVISGVHSCGKETCLVKACAEETDLDYVNPLEIPPMGDCDIAEIKRLYGKKLALMGNLHTTSTMLFGDTEKVRRDSLQLMLDAGEGGGFVLSTGDQCPRDTPDENIFEMVRVAKEFGQYPLNLDKIRDALNG